MENTNGLFLLRKKKSKKKKWKKKKKITHVWKAKNMEFVDLENNDDDEWYDEIMMMLDKKKEKKILLNVITQSMKEINSFCHPTPSF